MLDSVITLGLVLVVVAVVAIVGKWLFCQISDMFRSAVERVRKARCR